MIGTASSALLRPLREGRSLGLVSEAGCPAIADPGALLVEAAHQEGFAVIPLVGPCSIVLALMGSGLEGQRFAFCGYLPREETEICIETPYRSDALLGALLETCRVDTRLCVAADLMLASQSIVSKAVGEWRRSRAVIGRRPAVFLFQAAA